MGLITIDRINDGNPANANDINERFGKVTDVLNGNIESTNLKNYAVTREKIAPASVTSDKLSIQRYIDDNNWTVLDYGSTRSYRYQKTGTVSIGGMAGKEHFDIPLPVGVASLDDVFLSWSSQQQSQEIIYTVFPNPNRARIYVRAWNTINVPINGHKYTIDFVIEEKS